MTEEQVVTEKLPKGIVICVRVREGSPVPGSTTSECISCLEEVWITYSSKDFLEKSGSIAMCIACAKVRNAAGKVGPIALMPTEDAERELEQAGVPKPVAEALLEALKRELEGDGRS